MSRHASFLCEKIAKAFPAFFFDFAFLSRVFRIISSYFFKNVLIIFGLVSVIAIAVLLRRGSVRPCAVLRILRANKVVFFYACRLFFGGTLF
ncbi:MAG: hypothetical protein IJN12_01210 [Clostridia bacterium]|nr:hypothetical protein [Clostridia bacterium]